LAGSRDTSNRNHRIVEDSALVLGASRIRAVWKELPADVLAAIDYIEDCSSNRQII
jgi:hypothetical protein